jgi:hypothetical protein
LGCNRKYLYHNVNLRASAPVVMYVPREGCPLPADSVTGPGISGSGGLAVVVLWEGGVVESFVRDAFLCQEGGVGLGIDPEVEGDTLFASVA